MQHLTLALLGLLAATSSLATSENDPFVLTPEGYELLKSEFNLEHQDNVQRWLESAPVQDRKARESQISRNRWIPQVDEAWVRFEKSQRHDSVAEIHIYSNKVYVLSLPPHFTEDLERAVRHLVRALYRIQTHAKTNIFHFSTENLFQNLLPARELRPLLHQTNELLSRTVSTQDETFNPIHHSVMVLHGDENGPLSFQPEVVNYSSPISKGLFFHYHGMLVNLTGELKTNKPHELLCVDLLTASVPFFR